MTKTCPYCGWEFTPTTRHRAERVLPYCSHGCRLACASEPSHHGASHVSIDAAGEIEAHATEDQPQSMALAQVEHMAWVLIQLAPRERDVVLYRLRDWPYSEIGAALGVTLQAAEQCLADVMRRVPVVDRMFRVKRERSKARG
jgi:DNA-directed RNA polymerase specialized sigma24 family protein